MKWVGLSSNLAAQREAQLGNIEEVAVPEAGAPLAEERLCFERELTVWGEMAFWGTKVMEIVKKHDSGGLVWKRIKLTSTRKLNAKKRLLRVWQNEAVLKACAETPPTKSTEISTSAIS